MPNIEEIIAETEKKGTPEGSLDEILEQEKRQKMKELERLKIERLVAEEKARLNEVGTGGKPGSATVSQGFLSEVLRMSNVDPKKAASFIKELDEDAIRKISILAASENSQLPSLLSLAQNKGMDVKDTIDLIKTVTPPQQPQQPTSMKEMAEVITTIIAAMQSQNQNQGNRFTVQDGLELIKPLYQGLANKDRQLFETKLQQLSNQIVDPMAYFRSLKENAKSLGFSQGGNNLEIERLKLDQEKWRAERDWKMEQWKMEMGLKEQAEERKWNTVEKILGPLLTRAGPMADRLSGAAANAAEQRIKQAGEKKPKPPAEAPVLFICPECGERTELKPPYPEKIVCPGCEKEFKKEREAKE